MVQMGVSMSECSYCGRVSASWCPSVVSWFLHPSNCICIFDFICTYAIFGASLCRKPTTLGVGCCLHSQHEDSNGDNWEATRLGKVAKARLKCSCKWNSTIIHTHVYIYLYIYIFKCIYIYMCI